MGMRSPHSLAPTRLNRWYNLFRYRSPSIAFASNFRILWFKLSHLLGLARPVSLSEHGISTSSSLAQLLSFRNVIVARIVPEACHGQMVSRLFNSTLAPLRITGLAHFQPSIRNARHRDTFH